MNWSLFRQSYASQFDMATKFVSPLVHKRQFCFVMFDIKIKPKTLGFPGV